MPTRLHKKLSVQVANENLFLDSSGEFAFISHAHSDHISAMRAKNLIASEETLELLEARGYCSKEIKKNRIEKENVKLLNAGHVLGSKQVLVENSHRFLYTGDFKTSDSLTQKKAEVAEADVLAIDCTFGSKEYVFPKKEVIYESIAKWTKEQMKNGFSVLLGGYALGKAQELVKILNTYSSIEPIVTTEIARVNEVYNKYGISLQYVKETSQEAKELLKKQFVAVMPFHKVNHKTARGFSEYYKHQMKTAVATGWALHQGFSADEAFCLSDHSDFNEMLEYVEAVKPKRVICLNGFDNEFAWELRKRGYNAATLNSVKTRTLLEY